MSNNNVSARNYYLIYSFSNDRHYLSAYEQKTSVLRRRSSGFCSGTRGGFGTIVVRVDYTNFSALFFGKLKKLNRELNRTTVTNFFENYNNSRLRRR